jgi:hypothetical protein
MRAWTVDADDIPIADDLDVTLLHRTSWIESFLDRFLRLYRIVEPGR